MITYYEEGAGFHLPFNFELINARWEARTMEAAIDRYLRAVSGNGWPNWVLGNHDNPRVASRIGPASARVAAMLQLTLAGTSFIYYGEELGLENVSVPPDRIRDPVEPRMPGLGLGRDPQRAPMPWDEGRHAGFTHGEPWLPLGGNASRAVAFQRRDSRSFLSLYRRLIALRREEEALIAGDCRPLRQRGGLLAYLRQRSGSRPIVILLNFGGEAGEAMIEGTGSILLSTFLDREGENVRAAVALRGDEGVVVRLDS